MNPLVGGTEGACLSAPERAPAAAAPASLQFPPASSRDAWTRAQALPLLAALLVGLTALRIVALSLNGTDLFVDEAQYWAWSREPAFGYYSKPPLVAWIIAAATGACGNSEFCVRLPSPLIHALTSGLVYLIGRRLYSANVGFWSALAFATLPGISLSSGIISTDVPLLFAWALALLAMIELTEKPRLLWALVLGLAIGLGLNAKYAMAYFVPCTALFFLLAPEKAGLLKRAHLWIALLVGAALIAPNIAWNAANSFATFAHTADNTGWARAFVHPGKAAEFFGSQFGVFGPILFGALLVIAWRAARSFKSFPVEDRLLLAFSLPLIIAITIQAFLSHAFANWAAPAYVAATVLVTATMLREAAWGWLKGSLALNGTIAVLVGVVTWQAGNFELPRAGDPFARTLGNRELAAAVRAASADSTAAGATYAVVLADERDTVAAILYYAPELEPRVRAWRHGPRPKDHFELTRAFDDTGSAPVLLVSRQPEPASILKSFASVHHLGARELQAGHFTKRTVHLFALSGYRGG